MNTKIRTRFAPSPTGKMHVGNLRTALYAYLIAKHENGDFLIRIEDTDQERFVEGAIDIINRTMEKTGLIHDEGPDKDGGFGPYVQSERQKTGLYMKHALDLIVKGEAYYCFCDKDRLESLRGDGPGGVRYDKHCLNLSAAEVQQKLDAGMPYVIRQNNPVEGHTTFVDEIYGKITVDNSELDDMILMKSDGFPTYNFANVVDDHLMEITHVVRGNEYLSSSPKYNRLYEAFGWDVPVYIHCPLITDEENHKLSKRSGHASYEDLTSLGYLDETIVNYVALLGWSPDSNEEIFSLPELIEAFDYRRINKSPAVFDMKKFTWMNNEYIKHMDPDAFYKIAEPHLKSVITKTDLDLKKIAALVQTRLDVINDIPSLVDFFEALPAYDIELHTHKRMKTSPAVALDNLRLVLPVLEALDDFTLDNIHQVVLGFVESKGMKNGQMLWPLRTALSGKPSTPGGAFDIADILGKEESISRIIVAIEKLETEIK